MAEHHKVAIETTAQAYLELLAGLGIKYFFANAGTDFASMIDGFARRAHEHQSTPEPVLVPHECCAVSMAHGYYLATGQPSVVMVHTLPGTANALGALINAARSNIPLVLTAGRTPITEQGHPGSRDGTIHWGQESFDQAAMVREFVKYDYELRTLDQMETVVRRAFMLANAEPKGPVYLSLPREVLAEPHREFSFSTGQPLAPLADPYPDPAEIERLAALIAQASHPLILTRSLGRNHAAVGALATLAEKFAIGVIEYPSPAFMNLPTSHPMHLGFGPRPFLGQADLILVIDSDVPWIWNGMLGASPPAGAKVAHLGQDPLAHRYPIWGYPVDCAIQADSAKALPLLIEALEPYRKRHQSAIEERAQAITSEHRRQRAAWLAEAEQAGKAELLTPEWISHCLSEYRSPDTVFINEYRLSQRHLLADLPGTVYAGSAAGYLGWGLGASLGIKLGAPQKTVILMEGDGSYLFATPSACHLVAAARKLPTLTIVNDNGGWGAVYHAARGVHPEGWAVRDKNFPLVRFGAQPRYDKMIEAFGGHGEFVSSPREFPAVLARALKVVREEGRAALIHARCVQL
jgi:acetolactate synthase-1/2/3 large subunit